MKYSVNTHDQSSEFIGKTTPIDVVVDDILGG
jgi:hypothetical protein